MMVSRQLGAAATGGVPVGMLAWALATFGGRAGAASLVCCGGAVAAGGGGLTPCCAISAASSRLWMPRSPMLSPIADKPSPMFFGKALPLPSIICSAMRWRS